MKKLWLVGLAAIVLALVIAHFFSEVAVLSAEEVGERAAEAVILRLVETGVQLPEGVHIAVALSWFLRPGAYLISRFGIDPASSFGLCFACLSGWWGWLTLGRLVCCSWIGRSLGLTDIGTFRYWLMFAIPWRAPYRLIVMPLKRWWRQFRYGPRATAMWTGVLSAMTLVYTPGDCVYLGLLWWGGIGLYQPLGLRGVRHVFVVAAAGAGKTRWLMGWLGKLARKGAAYVIDVDGQIVNALGPALERQGHVVFNLDPYKLTLFPGACWNALEELTRAAKRHGRQAVVRFAQTLAEALIGHNL